MSAGAELRDLVRQIRTEIEWAQRIGIVVEPPREMPAPEPEPKKRAAASPRAPTPAPQPKPSGPPPMVRPSGPPSAAAMAAREAARAQILGGERPKSVTPPPPEVEEEPSQDLRPARYQRGDTPLPGRGWVPAPERAPTPLPADPMHRTLEDIRHELGDCTRCKLHKTRKNIVFGVGNPSAELMFIGEGPGANEDLQGEPFVGDAGALLTKMIEAMGFQRSDVYIANIVKCRPPGNRDPEPDEIEACEPFLKAQIASVKPKIIVTLGRPATHLLLRSKVPISSLRGQWARYQDIPVMPTFHPAYVLREPAQKRPVWSDLQAVVRALGRTVPTRGGG